MALKKIFLLIELVIFTALLTNSTFNQVSAQSELSQLNESIINCEASVTKLQMLLLNTINGTTENPPSTSTENPSDTTTYITSDTSTENPSNTTTENPSSTSTDNPSDTTTDITSDTSTDITSDNSTDTTTYITSDTSTDTTTENPPSTSIENSSDTTTDITSDTSTENPSNTTTENPPSTSTENPSDTSTDTTTDITSDTSTDIMSDNSTDTTTENPSNTTTENTSDTSVTTTMDTTKITTTSYNTGPAKVFFRKTTSNKLSQQNKWGKRVNDVLTNMDDILSDITENPYAVNSSDLDSQNRQMNILVSLGENFSPLVYGSDQALLFESSYNTLILVNESLIAVQNANNPPSNSSTTLIIWLVSVLLLCIIICIVLVVWKPWKKTVTKDDIPKWRDAPRNSERTPQPRGQSVNTQAAKGIQNQGFVQDLEIEEPNFAKLSIPRPVTIPLATRNVQPSGNLNRSSSKTPEPKIAPLPRSYKSYT